MKCTYWLHGILIISSIATIWAEIIGDDDEEDSSEHGNINIPGEKSTNCECGWANKEDQRIIGGEETKENEYPMMAGLFYKPRKVLFCGGTVITEYHVLTAAHCTEPFEEALSDLQVVVGEHDQDKVEESNATVYINVERYVEHEGYYLVGHRHDVSIIVLEEKIIFSNVVGPACLPSDPIDVVGHKLKVLGWGRLSIDGPSSKVLMKVYLNAVPLEECAREYEYIELMDQRQICTHHPTRDSCQGDSGGPLLWLDREINRYVLAAATSYGHECANNVPAVNSDISYYMPWIRKVVAETIPDAVICTKQD